MIALGSDHGGFGLKSAIIKHLEERGMEYRDFGCYNTDSCDYPVFGRAVGSEANCASAMIVLNTAVAEALTDSKAACHHRCLLHAKKP